MKGSLHKRETKRVTSNKTVKKDLNFLRDTDVVIKLAPSMKSDFRKRLYRDKEFLKSCNLMDYSLLLVVFSKKEYTDDN